MLRELNLLGQHFDLSETSPLGFSNAVVHWSIDISDISKGSLELISSTDKSGKSKPGKSLLVPDLRRNADESLLIDDGAEYIFGIGARGEKRQKLYLELLDRCIAETGNEIAKQIRDYITSCDVEELDRKISEAIPPKKKKDGSPEEREKFWWAKDRFIFILDGKHITRETPAIREWWSKYYASKQDVENGVCLLTGENTLTVGKKMPMMVKGVPGSMSSGAALTSFDKDAYSSYGWEGSANAPISFEAAIRLHKSLDILLRENRNHYKLGGQVFVFWGDNLAEGLNPELWKDPRGAIAKSIFDVPNRPSDLPGNRAMSRRFYLAALKGNRGRIALSSWNEQTSEAIKTSVLRFVESQEIIPGGRAKPIWVMRDAAFRKPNEEYTDKIDTALIRAVLLGEKLPDVFAIKICDRICAEQDVLKSSGKRSYLEENRVQALAFYLVSNQVPDKPNIMEQLKNLPTEAKLKPEQVAFILGRIAFLMHMAQVRAQNLTKEETNVSRSLRTLSTTPAIMFPRLYYGCIAHHLVDRDGKNLDFIRNSLDKEFGKFGANFNPAIDLPQNFDSKAQSCFFIGWGMRRAEFFTKKDGGEEKKEG